MKLIERFSDPNILEQMLLLQPLVQNNPSIAHDLIEKGELKEFSENEVIISQDDFDQDVYFILYGKVDIKIKGRKLPYSRGPNISIGEMAAINPAQARSASAISNEITLTLKVSPKNFTEIVKKYPEIFSRIAMDLSARLLQRNELIEQCNQKPNLFIISTKEALEIARSIKDELDYDDINVTIWSDAFKAGDYTLEILEQAVKKADFCLAIFQNDDITLSRGVKESSPRDNVVFELGFFMGVLGRGRTFITIPRDVPQKLASDFKGLTLSEYKITEENGPQVDVLVNKLRKTVKSLGIRDKI